MCPTSILASKPGLVGRSRTVRNTSSGLFNCRSVGLKNPTSSRGRAGEGCDNGGTTNGSFELAHFAFGSSRSETTNGS